MTRFVGIKQNRICIVSDNLFSNSELKVIEVPETLSHLSNTELITSCTIKNDQIKYKFTKKPAKDMKIALVANYGIKCGIGTYSKFLFNELINHIGDYKLFIEEADNYDFSDSKIPSDKLLPCWKRGSSLTNLVKQIKEYDPDIILIQHEFGLFPNASYWLSMMTQLSEYRVIVSMHSTFPNHKDKTIVEASAPEIIVHLEDAKNDLLNVKGVSNTIHVIPHGCYNFSSERLWNFYKTDHTLIQMGFGFKYKNFETTIEACSLLKKKYPDVFLTIIFSESEYSKLDHQIYYNELASLIQKLNLEENVSIIRGFQTDQVINSFLRTNKIAVFPYKSDPEHFVYGASGAARLAMAANLPVLSSKIPHFSDLPSIKINTSEDIANEADRLFSNFDNFKKQLEIQQKYIAENNWDITAQRYIKVFEM